MTAAALRRLQTRRTRIPRRSPPRLQHGDLEPLDANHRPRTTARASAERNPRADVLRLPPVARTCALLAPLTRTCAHPAPAARSAAARDGRTASCHRDQVRDRDPTPRLRHRRRAPIFPLAARRAPLPGHGERHRRRSGARRRQAATLPAPSVSVAAAAAAMADRKSNPTAPHRAGRAAAQAPLCGKCPAMQAHPLATPPDLRGAVVGPPGSRHRPTAEARLGEFQRNGLWMIRPTAGTGGLSPPASAARPPRTGAPIQPPPYGSIPRARGARG